MNTHGNAKITKQEYIRTSPITKNQIISEIKTGKLHKFSKTHFFLKNFSPNINLVMMLNTPLTKKMHLTIGKTVQMICKMLLTCCQNHIISEGNCAICRNTSKCKFATKYTDYQMKHFSSACKTSISGTNVTTLR